MNELVTIVGSSYFDPISSLLEKLDKYQKNQKGDVKAGNRENGYATSICLLSVVCLESYVMRARYMHGATGNELNRMPVTGYLNKIYSDYPYCDETNEIFVIRDLIAHNHLIKITYEQDDSGVMIGNGFARVSSGDKKFSANVSKDTKRTLILGLNTNPISVCYTDALTILQTVWRNLLFLEGKDRNQCYVSHLSAGHKGKMVKFGKIIQMPETCT